ncbi:MAG: hypothetical protein P1P74_11645 [Desulfuromonadales bacterium]|nr:hypothetical protein [Desulfuromonadales bacterium]
MIKFRLSPYSVLLIAAILSCVSLFSSGWLATRQPWLGLTLQAQETVTGVLVTKIHPNSPADLILSPNDVIYSIASNAGNSLTLQGSDLIEDPDVFPTFAAYHTFLERQSTFADFLREPVVILTLEDGREVRLQPAGSRPVRSLPAKFWFLNTIGMISCLLGVGIFSVRLNLHAAQVYAIAGIGLLVSTMAMAVIASRELAFEPGFMLQLRTLYHVGNNIYALFAIFLLALYPSRLKSLFLPWFVALLMLFFLGNEFFEWADLPGNTTLIQAPIYMAIAIIIGFLQWLNSRPRAIDQAAFKWFLLAFLIPTGLGCFLYFGLLLISGRAVFSVSVGLGCFLFMHVSLALGIMKYRLFDIDRWWFQIWLWFFAGVSVLVVDSLLVFCMNLGSGLALSFSLLFVGWVYFPVRQSVMGRVYPKHRKRFEQYLPILVAGIVGQQKHGDLLWEFVLAEIFNPFSQKLIPENIPAPKILQYGQILQVPGISGVGAIELTFPEKGRRLFSSMDVRLVEELHKISSLTESRLAAHTRGTREERERILRDLHDDIGGRLLSLAQTASSQQTAQLAREALTALREIVYSLDPQVSITLDEALAKWRQNLHDRCDSAGVFFDWQIRLRDNNYLLTPRQLTNLSRILSEALTNAFKHADLDHLRVTWSLENRELRVSICNNGVKSDLEKFIFGKGLKNMQRRISDLGGTLQHFCSPEEHSFELQFSLPLSAET